MSDYIRIQVTATLTAAMHILGPGRTMALTERPIELDTEGYPLIPASSIRGRIRAQLERLLVATGAVVCKPPVADQMCPHYSRHSNVDSQSQSGNQIHFANQPETAYCMACRIFGSSWRAGALVTDNLLLVEQHRLDYAELLRTERTSVSISRRLGVAQSARLFSTETTVHELQRGEPLTFSGVFRGRLSRVEAGWLLAALQSVTHVGGNKARGLGSLQLHVAEVAWRQHGQWVTETDPTILIEEALTDANL